MPDFHSLVSSFHVSSAIGLILTIAGSVLVVLAARKGARIVASMIVYGVDD